jgi:ubiquinone/menaquinone biosynthesis C-methylase UbiE
MELYDAVAEKYSAVFDDIGLRLFEWPWIRGLVEAYGPRSLLDLGCGNGYLSKALGGMVPELYALEPSSVMCSIAEKNLNGAATLRQGKAESMPFGDHSFDLVVSLLRFRYMVWDKALDEVRRVLKDDGVFLLVDLFAGKFKPLYLHKYLASRTAVYWQYIRHGEYRKKLRCLTRNRLWQQMVREHPKRELSLAKEALEQKFLIKDFRLLSLGLRGLTAGFVCGKKTMCGLR